MMDISLSHEARIFKRFNMKTAEIYYANRNETNFRRACRVNRFYYENMTLPSYVQNQRLFSIRKKNLSFRISDYNLTFLKDIDSNNNGLIVGVNGVIKFDDSLFSNFINSISDEFERNLLNRVRLDCLASNSSASNTRYNHGGSHWIPNFKRLLKEGLDGYKERVIEKLEKTADKEKEYFYEGLLEVIDGIKSFLFRYREYLRSVIKSDENNIKLRKLLDALEQVPEKPARSFYEAILATQAIMHLSGCCEPGHIDDYLYSYYEKDLLENKTTYEEAQELLEELICDIDENSGTPSGLHMVVGGTRSDGTALYNDLTEMAIKIIKKYAQPNLSLRVRKDMPEHIWSLVLKNMKAGSAQPALVNEELFIKGLTEQYGVPEEEALQFGFGGCSETLIEGKTNVDSTWVAFNMLDIFEQTMYSKLLQSETFEDFYKYVKEDLYVYIKDMVRQINLRQHEAAINRSAPLCTLFTDDCIEKGKSYFDGGARYNFDSANVYGSTNVINSLYIVKKLFDGEFKGVSKEEFLEMMRSNYETNETLYKKIKNIKKFGNYCPEIDNIAKDLMNYVFNEIRDYKCYRGNGSFMPAVVLWVTWEHIGKVVGATPDGRKKLDVLADSIGPSQGTDTEGPTAMMNSVTSIPQHLAVGTCTLNLKLDPKCFDSSLSIKKVKALLEGYFALGGLQIQTNVVNTETLKDAMKNPEGYGNLVVRVGGFSGYFVKLNDRIKWAIIERNMMGN